MLFIAFLSLIAQVYQCQEIEFFTPFGMAEVEGVALHMVGNESGGVMQYNSKGTVMKGPVNVYLIFYGRNWGPAKRFKIENFVKNMDDSSYFSIIKKYYDEEGPVTGPLILRPSVWLDHEYGMDLSVKNIVQIIADIYPTTDNNGIYAFLTDVDTDVHYSETLRMCSEFCGFHTIHRTRKIAFVGDSGRCTTCTPFRDTPSRHVSTDGIINILAHEIVETLSNPDTRNPTWKDEMNQENADRCNFNMGVDNPVDLRGNRYNVIMGDLKYYVQTYWSLVKKACALSD